MGQIWAVFKREVGLYFRSPIAYAIAFAMMLFLGILVNGYIVQANQAYPVDVTLAPGVMVFLLFLIAPLLTMRLLAEESREGTLEVLMTLPMNESSFIIGKFLAAWFFYTVLLALTLVYYVIWMLVGVPDEGVAFGAYFGAWLYGGTVLAVTIIWSAITEDQVVAAFLGAATVLVLYLTESAAIFISGSASQTTAGPNGLAEFVRQLGLQAHYNATMLRGIIRAEDIAYFVFMIIAALFITTRIIETRRWRS
jgi:ABC-2 type transport system permease protein